MNTRSKIGHCGRSAALIGLIFTTLGGAAPVGAQSAAELFAPIAAVMKHPRCLNCHVKEGQPPLQGDEGRPHRMKITGGADGHGAPAARCHTCHRDQAVGPLVPASPTWYLPPKEMAWQGLTESELCRKLKTSIDGWSREKTIDHFENDKTVVASWKGGPDRSKVSKPEDRVDFLKAVGAWLDAKKDCP